MAIYKNHEQYSDPTAGQAIENITKKQKKKSKSQVPDDIDYLVRMFKQSASVLGYDIVERIVFQDRGTGKIWR